MELNGKIILIDSLEVDGIDRNDYPDFCDAFFSDATFSDGTSLSDDQLDILSDTYRDILHSKVFDHIY